MNRLMHSFLGLLILLLTSCIDGEEEVFIHADGSGRLKAVYKVQGFLLSAEEAEKLRVSIAEEMATQKHLKLLTNRVDQENGNRVITLEIVSDNVMKLEGALSSHTPGVVPSKSDKILHALVGRLTIQRQGLTAEINRDVDLQPLLEEYLGKRSTSLLGASEFRYALHLPYPAERSNAHQVADGGRTLMWNYRLSECKSRPISLNVVASLKLPWWSYALAVLVLLILGLLLRAWWRGRR